MKSLKALTLVLFAILLGPATLVRSAPDQVVAVKVGRVIPVSGPEIENATILVEEGRITAVGTDVEIPLEARVHSFPDGVALPGIVDCHSTTGLRIPQENLADVPFVRMVDGIDPSSPGLENARRDGVTTIHVLASSATRFGGQGAIIRSSGRMVDEMVVRSPSAMKISLQPPRGETRMGNMAVLRKAFHDLHARLKAIQEEGEEPDPIESRPEERPSVESIVSLRPRWDEINWEKIPEEKIAERDRPLADLVRGRLPAFIECPTASDVFKALELIEVHGLKATLVLGRDAWKLKDVLALREDLGPVVLDPALVVWESDPRTGREVRHCTPLELHRAGVEFALQVEEDRAMNRGPYFSRRGGYHFWYQAALLVRHGVPREEALRSITLTPAKILGLDGRLGSIEKGKDGNITVFSGDPLDARSWVELVLIEGEAVYEKNDDRDLELLLRPPKRTF